MICIGEVMASQSDSIISPLDRWPNHVRAHPRARGVCYSNRYSAQHAGHGRPRHPSEACDRLSGGGLLVRLGAAAAGQRPGLSAGERLEQRATLPKVRVFISYSTSDTDFADVLRSRLESAGHTVWIDRGRISGGTDWRLEIDEGLERADAVIVVMTPSARNSEYVAYEWANALGRGRRVVPPLVLEPTDLPARLAPLHYLDFSNPRQRPWEDLQTALAGRVDPAAMVTEVTSLQAPRELTVGILRFPPIGEYVQRGIDDPGGLYVQLLEMMAAVAGISLRLTDQKLTSLLSDLSGGRIDCVAGVLTSPRKAQALDFAALLYSVDIVGVTRGSKDLGRDLSTVRRSGKSMLVAQGSVAAEMVGSGLLADEDQSRLTAVEVGGIDRLLGQVETEQADVAFLDSLSYAHYMEQRPDCGLGIGFGGTPLWRSGVGFAMTKGSSLMPWVNRSLRETAQRPDFLELEADFFKRYAGYVDKLWS